MKRNIEDAKAWRSTEFYQHMLAMDRVGWAWLWLRRNGAYNRTISNTAEPTERQLRPQGVNVIKAQGSRNYADWGLSFRR